MFDRRLFKELNNNKKYYVIGTAAAIAAVSLTIWQALLVAELINDVFIRKRLFTGVSGSLILLCVIIALKSLIGGFYEYYNRKCAIKIKGSVRRRLIKAIIKRGPVKLRNESLGSLTSHAEEAVEALDAYYSEFIPQLFIIMVSIPMILYVVSKRDLVSGLVMLVTAPLIPVFMILIGRMAEYFNKNQWKALQKMSGHLLDVLRGLSTLKLFGKSKTQLGSISRVSEAFKENTMGILKISFLSALVLELIATLSTAILAVILGVRLLYGKMNFNDAFFILLMAPEYYQPLRGLGAKFHAAMSGKAAADNIFPILEGEYYDINTIEDKIKICEKLISIDIDNISFSYETGKKAISNVSFSLEENTRIALVGPSGGGKSTLIALLMGFLRDYEGSIRLNGMELKEIEEEAWTKKFAYVSQQPKLFRASILENISISRPEASYGEILQVSKELGIDGFVQKLPKGFDTIVGEGGIALSGGQIQLIALGRAYLKGADLIILDEPTSALDISTEKILGRAMEIISKNRFVITIAHRLPTIINSDVIYVLRDGRILEAGKHSELMEAGGLYHELVTAGEGGDIL